MAKTYEVTQLLYCKDLGSYIDAPAIVPSSEIRYVGNEYMGPQFENPIMTRLELSGGKYMLVRNSPTEFNDLGNPVVFSSEDDGKSIVINFAEKIVQPDGYYHISGVGYLHRIWPKWIDLIIGLLEGHKIPYTFLLSSKSEVGMSGQTLSLVFGECFTRTEIGRAHV